MTYGYRISMLNQERDSLSMSSGRMSLCWRKCHLLLFMVAIDNRVVPVVDDILPVKVHKQKDLILYGGKEVVGADEFEHLWFAEAYEEWQGLGWLRLCNVPE